MPRIMSRAEKAGPAKTPAPTRTPAATKTPTSANAKTPAPTKTPKKSSKKLIIIITVAVIVAGAGGGGAFYLMSDSTPTKGTVTALSEALTINLAGKHYLKLNFSIQQNADAGTTAVDTAQAVDAAIDTYTGKTIAELATVRGRSTTKAALLASLHKAYTTSGKDPIMDIYFTTFVTQ